MTYLFSFIRFFSFALLMCMFAVTPARAQESQSLSVTPPLFQLSVLPGDMWQSNIKVVNNNPYPLTVYADVVNFKATGEMGQGTFVPIMNDSADKATLAEWIDIPHGPYIVAPEQSTDISFFVEVPKDAAPGGHYAAILISTEPPKTTEKIVVQTSQVVTSLFFVRIEGAVEEIGSIREFRATDSFLSTPEAQFSLRFENKGNVHLQPRGDIVITNMWGTERGVIPVNYQTHFGNVLPQSIRDFTFSWKSEFSFADIGRYKAVATLVYGEDGVKTVTATTYFWVIPVKATVITLLIIAAFIALIVFMVKAYVRRVLVLAGVDVSKTSPESLRERQQTIAVRATTYRKVSAPIRDGVLDLRQRLTTAEEEENRFTALVEFIKSYRLFFISLAVLTFMGMSIGFYISKATNEDTKYEVTVEEGGKETTLGSDEVRSIQKQ